MRIPTRRLLGLLAALVLVSCGGDHKDSNKPDPDTPFPYAKPSLETMQMDLHDLGSGQSPTSAAGGCHALSTLAVAWINLNVVLRLAVPMSAFAACLNSQPVYLGDDTWRWTATGGQGADAATGELEAHVVSQTQIDWSVRVSGTQESYDRFLWFAGSCDPSALSGVWHYYDPASRTTPREVIRCTWSQGSMPGAPRQIEFENAEQGAADLGDVLSYEVVEYTASIMLVDASDADTAWVSWNTITGEGRTETPHAGTCCWGSRDLGYPDVTCP